MEPGFLHVGWREVAAVWLATVIILDWAAVRYLDRRPNPRAHRGRIASPPAVGGTPSRISEPPAGD